MVLNGLERGRTCCWHKRVENQGVTAVMQVYNTVEWLQEDTTSNEMWMHAIILLLLLLSTLWMMVMLYRSGIIRLYTSVVCYIRRTIAVCHQWWHMSKHHLLPDIQPLEAQHYYLRPIISLLVACSWQSHSAQVAVKTIRCQKRQHVWEFNLWTLWNRYHQRGF